MDLLTDILQQSGLRRRVLEVRRLPEPSALRFPCERSMGLHVVTQGHVYIHADAMAEPLALQAGDIALMARGCHHVVSTQATPPTGTVATASVSPGQADEAAPGDASIISGAYQFWHEPLHPVFTQLPRWSVVRLAQRPQLAPLSLSVALLGSEAATPGLGSESIVHGLLDVAFGYLLREVLEGRGLVAARWTQALRTAPVRQAVELLHADTGQAWTLDDLARRVGVSRTSLAGKFREAMGDTPLNYLRTLRMQKAMQLLASTDAGLEQVATQLGYTDAFSFSKVFKKVVGIAPREFRRRDLAERRMAWRF